MKISSLARASFLLMFSMTLAGCPPRRVNLDEQSQSDVRENRAPAPPTGVKQNPGRPEQPATAPSPD